VKKIISDIMPPPPRKIRKILSYFQKPNSASASNEGNQHESISIDSFSLSVSTSASPANQLLEVQYVQDRPNGQC